MISVSSQPDFAALAARLAQKAKALAAARMEKRALSRRADPRRWRKAALLWPLFGER